jgi:cell pole-organizing protein PopZ
MEEILASIRRIIADDDPAKGPPKASEPRPAAPPPRPVPPSVPTQPVAESQKELDTMLAQLQAKSQPAPQPVEGPASDSLDLTEQRPGPEPAPTPGFRTIDGQSDIVFEERAPEPPPPSEPPAPPRAMEPPPRRPHDDGGEGGEHGLVSAATTAAVDSAFNTLAQTVPVQNGRTLEDLVKEMLRPQLKTWLDDNLPGMVERLVRAEIERVSRGRG